jgi:hypothetical protein
VVCAGGHGILEISTLPLGHQNPGAFAFRVDGGSLNPLPSSGTVSIELTAGDHVVEILEIPLNCRVLGLNPRPVNVPSGGRALVSFTIHCDPFAPGSLVVSVITSGSVPDPDGYQVQLNGDTQYPLRPSDRLVIEGLIPGHHLIALLGVSVNCRVEGGKDRIPFVPVGGVAEEEYVITCSSG